MTSITTNVKHRVRTTGSEHQGQNSFSDPDQKFGFTCIFSSGMQEQTIHNLMNNSWNLTMNTILGPDKE